MDNTLFELIKVVNPIQTILFIIFGIIFYFKIKNNIFELKNEINGLGKRFDNQFGEYKNTNTTEIDSLKERIYKVEIELQLSRQYQSRQSENYQ